MKTRDILYPIKDFISLWKIEIISITVIILIIVFVIKQQNKFDEVFMSK